MLRSRLPRLAALVAISLSALAWMPANVSAVTNDSDAPTPYPTHAADWPGQGVIRNFDWMRGNREHFWRERSRKQGSVVFAGDSLTAQWTHLAAAFPGMSIANRGIGGDVSRGLLFRFEEDVLSLNPAAIVILIGTNDLTAHQPAAQTLSNLEDIVTLTRARAPGAALVLCTVPPSNHPKAPVRPEQQKALNAGVRALAERDAAVELVDLYRATLDANGQLDARLFKADRLHLSAAGYERWKETLVPVLQARGLLKEHAHP